jgi:hypothetical protein
MTGWEPSWRRLLASTAVVFALVLAFLAGRVHSGADPALGNTSAGSSATPDATGVDPYGMQGGQAPDTGAQPPDQTGQGGLDPLTTRQS